MKWTTTYKNWKNWHWKFAWWPREVACTKDEWGNEITEWAWLCWLMRRGEPDGIGDWSWTFSRPEDVTMEKLAK